MFIMGIIGVSTWLIGVIDLLTPSRPQAPLYGLPYRGPLKCLPEKMWANYR